MGKKFTNATSSMALAGWRGGGGGGSRCAVCVCMYVCVCVYRVKDDDEKGMDPAAARNNAQELDGTGEATPGGAAADVKKSQHDGFSRVAFAEKAGNEGMRNANAVVYEMSKNSRYFKNQVRRDEAVTIRIRKVIDEESQHPDPALPFRQGVPQIVHQLPDTAPAAQSLPKF